MKRGGGIAVSGRARALVAFLAVGALVLTGCQILGSPVNVFGNDPTRSGTQPGVWAAINGPFSSHSDGDPYSTECAGQNATATSCGTTDSNGNTVANPNPLYNPNGYEWAIDVPAADAGSTVTVAIYDPSFGPNATLSESYSGANTGFATSYQLFESTGEASANTPPSMDQSLGMNSVANGPTGGTQGLDKCTGGSPGYQVFPPGATSQNAWYTLCTFTVPVAFAGGIYPLQVKSSAIPGVADAGTGYNAFSIRAISSATSQPMVYPVGAMSIWTGAVAGSSRFYLANIDDDWAGHSLVIDAFDPGDGSSGNTYVHVLGPPSGAPSLVPTGGTALPCSYSAPTVTKGPSGASYSYSDNCTIQTRNGSSNPANIYNDRWMRIVVPIPSDYSCTVDCWFTLQFDYGGTNTDRSVWVLGVRA
jgi:hypothetical protein